MNSTGVPFLIPVAAAVNETEFVTTEISAKSGKSIFT
jgi:hypothetical protein